MNQVALLDIYLDDLRQPPAGFTLVRNIDECLLLMKEVRVRRLSLDYHLGNGRTADEVVDFIIQEGIWPREIYLHSSDMAARRRMYMTLRTHAPTDVAVFEGPFR